MTIVNNLLGNTPKLIYLQLTEACNLRCKMCYEWGDSGTYKSKKECHVLEIQAIKRIVDECKSVRPTYWLYGGEPLLYPHLEEALKYIKDNEGTIEIDTNGVLLKDKAEILVKNAVSMIHVSLDGPEKINDYQRGPGSYQHAIEGIAEISRLKRKYNQTAPKISIGTTITAANYRYLVDFYGELDLNSIQHVSLELQAFITDEEIRKYEQFLRTNFNIESVDYINGYKRDVCDFKGVDPAVIESEVNKIEELCRAHNIEINKYPKILSQRNCDHYFRGEKSLLEGIHERCVFPWVYVEITARGLVAPCHSFYDLTFGSIYEESLLGIWRGDSYKKFRSLCRHNSVPNCYACCLFYHNRY